MDTNLKIGIMFSSFDLLHAGHIKMLEEAKRKCDF
jgi:glycerol-3-phosphate cytidylyltransferase